MWLRPGPALYGLAPACAPARSRASLPFVAYVTLLVLARPLHSAGGARVTSCAVRFRATSSLDPVYKVQHAVTIHAPPEEIWPWLAQIATAPAASQELYVTGEQFQAPHPQLQPGTSGVGGHCHR